MKNQIIQQKRELFLVIGIFILAIILRLWFASLAPQPFWWDQEEYEKYAAKMMQSPLFLASHSYRSYPFPLMLAVLYSVVGFGNHQAVFVFNAILDGLTGVLVFFLLKEGLKHTTIAWLGYIFYVFNPFTSGYVGLVLSENLSAFLIAGVVYVGVLFIKKPTAIMGLLLGILAGLAAETRNAAFAWAAVPVGLTLIFVSWKKYLRTYIAVAVGIFFTVLYPMYVNWRDYHEINFTTVDSITAREFFNGAVLKILPPFTNWYPQEVQEMYHEYYSEFYPRRSAVERKAMAAKYMRKGWEIVKSDPVDYIRWRFFKMWYVWQKENIFFIRESGYEQHKYITYTINLVLLVLGIIGLIGGWGLSRSSIFRYIMGSILGTVLYGTLVFSISHAEYRLTIPFYPLVIAASAVGVGVIAVTILNSKYFLKK